MIRNIALSLCISGLAVACGGDDDGGGDGGSCADSTLTYDNFGSSFFSDYCLQCHASANTGADRNGAPATVNFDDMTAVLMHTPRINARAGTGTSMPPGGAPATPSAAEREDLAEWIGCGAK